MKKVYSQRAGTEVFALAPEQLEAFKNSGYETPTAAEAIADAGAIKITPPEGKRAYVAFDFKKGEFFVRVRTCTLRGNEVGGLVGEIVQAAITKSMVERADPDRPKAEPTQKTGASSPLVSAFLEELKKALAGKAQTAHEPETSGEEVSK